MQSIWILRKYLFSFSIGTLNLDLKINNKILRTNTNHVNICIKFNKINNNTYFHTVVNYILAHYYLLNTKTLEFIFIF